MKRTLSIILADAFDNAAHNVCTAAEVHHHYGLAEPTNVDAFVYWWRGLFAGLCGDHEAMPLWHRGSRWVIKLLPITIAQRR